MRQHRTERLCWCRNNVNQHLRDWHDMLFSDNHASALITMMAVSVCIDIQVKRMLTHASWSGTDGVEQTLWYGEAAHMVSECSLLF